MEIFCFRLLAHLLQRRRARLEEETEEEEDEQKKNESLDGEKYNHEPGKISKVMTMKEVTLTITSRRLSHLSFLLQATCDSAWSRKTKSRIPCK